MTRLEALVAAYKVAKEELLELVPSIEDGDVDFVAARTLEVIHKLDDAVREANLLGDE